MTGGQPREGNANVPETLAAEDSDRENSTEYRFPSAAASLQVVAASHPAAVRMVPVLLAFVPRWRITFREHAEYRRKNLCPHPASEYCHTERNEPI